MTLETQLDPAVWVQGMLDDFAAQTARDIERASEPVPVIWLAPSGDELVVGEATSTLGAEQLMKRIEREHPGERFEIDVTRNPEEVRA